MCNTQCITKYVVEFNWFASQLEWGPTALCHQFYKGLPAWIKDDITWVRKPKTFIEMRTLSQSIDAWYWEHWSKVSHKSSSHQKLEASSLKTTPIRRICLKSSRIGPNPEESRTFSLSLGLQTSIDNSSMTTPKWSFPSLVLLANTFPSNSSRKSVKHSSILGMLSLLLLYSHTGFLRPQSLLRLMHTIMQLLQYFLSSLLVKKFTP